MLDATPVGVALLSDHVFTKVNDSLCRITGYSEGELIGKSPGILYDEQDEFNRISEEFYKPFEGKGVRSLESRIHRKDNESIDVIISLSPFDPADPDSGVTITILDVTEQREPKTRS